MDESTASNLKPIKRMKWKQMSTPTSHFNTTVCELRKVCARALAFILSSTNFSVPY